jgi:hypothetical protein
MAEKGSAGQVGGMEAKAEVRERLARESKNWRCEGCGGRTNNEIMREWWEICKERGVKVEEEMSLEQLPEGLSLEAKEPKSKAEDGQPRKETQPEPPQAVSSPSADKEVAEGSLRNLRNLRNLPAPTFDSTTPAGVTAQHLVSNDPTQHNYPSRLDSNLTASHNALPTGGSTCSTSHTSESLLSHKKASHQSDLSDGSHPKPSANTHAVTAPAPANTTRNATPNNVVAYNNAESTTGTIDKAIGALFVALLIMILKKIFYPAGGSGSSVEGVYMSGE